MAQSRIRLALITLAFATTLVAPTPTVGAGREPRPEDWIQLEPIPKKAQLSYRYEFHPLGTKLPAAIPGDELQLDVRTETYDRVGLALTECKQTVPEPPQDSSPAPITVKGRGRELLASGLENRTVTIYHRRMSIRPDAEPRVYQIGLTFVDPKGKSGPDYRAFKLPVLPKDTGRVKLQIDEPIELTLGGKNDVEIKVMDNYVDYPINITGTWLGAKAKELIGKVETDPIIDENRPLRLFFRDDAKPVTLKLDAPASLNHVDRWFDTESLLDVRLLFTEGYHVTPIQTDATRIKVKVRFATALTLAGALLGAILGSLLRVAMEAKGASDIPSVNTRTQKVGSILCSIVLAIAIVVSLLLLDPELVLSNIHARVGIDNPIAAFVVGVVLCLDDTREIARKLRALFSFGGSSKPVSADPQG
jgi:hypothetical protein